MSINRMLFPAENPQTDFASAAGGRGWVPVNNTGLVEMSSKIINNDSNESKVTDHAIPSPIASFREFYTKLSSESNQGHENAVKEWRGMIAAIALQNIKSIEISVKEIPLFKSGNGDTPSTFASVILDCLLECKESGYKMDEYGIPNYKKLTVFCKKDNRGKDIPFAMFMPSIGICPFKEYPSDLFAGLEWYDDKDGWKEFSLSEPTEQILDITSQKLYLWLKQFDNDQYPARYYFKKFAEDLLIGNKPEPIPSEDKNSVPANYSANSLEFYQDFKNICPINQKAPKNAFADKLLIIIPSGSPANSESPFLESDINDVFVPQKKNIGDKYYYVLPPIHNDVVESYKNGAALNDLNVIPEMDEDMIVGFTVKFRLVIESEKIFYSHFWSIYDVIWTDSIPYISIWPFVKFSDNSWKDYKVSVFKSGLENKKIEGSRKASAYSPIIKKAQKVTGIKDSNGTMLIKIDLINKGNGRISRHSCCSTYRDYVTFDILQSESIPVALSFSCKISGINYLLGCWIIKYDSSKEINAGENESIIAMDFGSTSTNVYIKKNSNNDNDYGESISSSKNYVKDIYNPFHKTDRDFIQKYYLFGHDADKMGKIFTYGQNLTVDDVANNEGKKYGTIPNVTGRFVKTDERFLPYHNEGDMIEKDLKWPSDDKVKPSKKKAAKNFVSHILLTALLDAKCNQAKKADIRLSYPQNGFGDVILESIDVDYLKKASGLSIEIKGETEAVCAGAYYGSLPISERPSIEDGYAIIDIGGGTTDFSFWKGNDSISDVKNQHTFKYAGQELVEKTICQFIKDDVSFRNMWVNAPKKEDAAKDEQTPFSIYTNDEKRKSHALIYVLDKYEKDAEAMRSNEESYKYFLQAIRMKYYALFLLIACHIYEKRAKGEIELDEKNLSVCLAGCGSKGIEFCKISEKQFIKKLEELFNYILFEDEEDYIQIRISEPTCDNKEEVVKGLIQLENIGTISVSPKASILFDHKIRRTKRGNEAKSYAETNETDSNVNSNTETSEKESINIGPTPTSELTREEVYEAYQFLCDTIAELEKDNLKADHLLNKISLGYYDNQGDYYENSDVRKYLDRTYTNLKREAAKYNPDPDTYKETIALAIFDEMIDYFKDEQ